MVMAFPRAGGPPSRKPASGTQQGSGLGGTSSNSGATSSSNPGAPSVAQTAMENSRRQRRKSPDQRRSATSSAPQTTATMVSRPAERIAERTNERASRHAPQPDSSVQHRGYPAQQNSRMRSRSPPSNHHQGSPPSVPPTRSHASTSGASTRFPLAHHGRSFSRSPPPPTKGGNKRTATETRPLSSSPKRSALHQRLSSPTKRNRSKSPADRYSRPVSLDHISSRSRPSGISMERPGFRGPDQGGFDPSSLKNITVGINHRLHNLTSDPVVRQIQHPEDVVLLRRPGNRRSRYLEEDSLDFDLDDNSQTVRSTCYTQSVSPCYDEPPSTNPQDYHFSKWEGTQPMFERLEISQGIAQRRLEERGQNDLGRFGLDGSVLPSIEQRVVAIIREPVILPGVGLSSMRSRSRERYYEGGERRTRDREYRREGSRDRHYSRYHSDGSRERHYDRRNMDDLRLDLEMRRRESERGHGRDEQGRRSRSRESRREYYSRHPEYREREYRDRERERERDHHHRHSSHRDERMRERGGEHRHRRHSSSRDREGHHDRGSSSYRAAPPHSSSRPSSDFHPQTSSSRRENGEVSERTRTTGNEKTEGSSDAQRNNPTWDPEFVPRGNNYFEHDIRGDFSGGRGSGRGGPPNFHPSPRFPFPGRGFLPRGPFRGATIRGIGGRGVFVPPPPPPFRGGPPHRGFFRGGPRGGPFPRTKARSPEWKHDLFEATEQEDEQPSSTTADA